MQPLLILGVKSIRALRKDLTFENYSNHLRVYEQGKATFCFISHKWYNENLGDSPTQDILTWLLANLQDEDNIWMDICCIPQKVDLEIKAQFIASIPFYLEHCQKVIVLTFSQEKYVSSAWCFFESLAAGKKLSESIDLTTRENFYPTEELRLVQVTKKDDYSIVMNAIIAQIILKHKTISTKSLKHWVEVCDLVNGKKLEQSWYVYFGLNRKVFLLVFLLLLSVITAVIAVPLSLSLVPEPAQNSTSSLPTFSPTTTGGNLPVLQYQDLSEEITIHAQIDDFFMVNGEEFVLLHSGQLCDVKYNMFRKRKTFQNCRGTYMSGGRKRTVDQNVLVGIGNNAVFSIATYPFNEENVKHFILDENYHVVQPGPFLPSGFDWLPLWNVTHEFILFFNGSLKIIDHSTLDTEGFLTNKFVDVWSECEMVIVGVYSLIFYNFCSNTTRAGDSFIYPYLWGTIMSSWPSLQLLFLIKHDCNTLLYDPVNVVILKSILPSNCVSGYFPSQPVSIIAMDDVQGFVVMGGLQYDHQFRIDFIEGSISLHENVPIKEGNWCTNKFCVFMNGTVLTKWDYVTDTYVRLGHLYIFQAAFLWLLSISDNGIWISDDSLKMYFVPLQF